MGKEKYCRKIVRAGCTVDVQFTYPTRYGEGLTRSKHNPDSVTPADVEAYNHSLACGGRLHIRHRNVASTGADDLE